MGTVVIVLTGLYLVVVAGSSPWDVAFGAGAATGALALTGRGRQRRPPDAPPMWRRALWFAPFVGAVLASAARDALSVARIVLGIGDPPTAGIIEVPLEPRSDVGVAVSMLALTLAPGSVLVDVDEGRKMAYVHVIDASDPDDIRRHVRNLYERYQAGVFP